MQSGVAPHPQKLNDPLPMASLMPVADLVKTYILTDIFCFKYVFGVEELTATVDMHTH